MQEEVIFEYVCNFFFMYLRVLKPMCKSQNHFSFSGTIFEFRFQGGVGRLEYGSPMIVSWGTANTWTY